MKVRVHGGESAGGRIGSLASGVANGFAGGSANGIAGVAANELAGCSANGIAGVAANELAGGLADSVADTRANASADDSTDTVAGAAAIGFAGNSASSDAGGFSAGNFSNAVEGSPFTAAAAAVTLMVVNENTGNDLDGFVDAVVEEAAVRADETARDGIMALARSLEGVPYRYGGTTPAGFDCSGFVQYVFRNAIGVELPRTAAGQSGLGQSVSFDEARPGDLVFWGSGSGVYHVGIYAGDNSYIHAPQSGGGVCLRSFEYYAPAFAKRIL